MVNASAIISNPASMLTTLFTFAPALSRLDRCNATSAEFNTLLDGGLEGVSNSDFIFSRPAHVFKNFPNSLVGGFRSSRIYKTRKEIPEVWEETRTFEPVPK